MSSQIMVFASKCKTFIKDSLIEKNGGMDIGEMTLVVEPFYGKVCKENRIGVTINTIKGQSHPDLVGYRFKIGFPTKELRTNATHEINTVSEIIKNTFDLLPTRQALLRDKDSNEVWFTFISDEEVPSAFFEQKLLKNKPDMETFKKLPLDLITR